MCEIIYMKLDENSMKKKKCINWDWLKSLSFKDKNQVYHK